MSSKLDAKESSSSGSEEEEEVEEEEEAVAGEGRKHSRSEKKSRKAMQKLGMKPVYGITRVTVKQSKKAVLAIESPDVFKSPSSDTYIIFGEASHEDLGAQAQSAAAAQFRGPVSKYPVRCSMGNGP